MMLCIRLYVNSTAAPTDQEGKKFLKTSKAVMREHEGTKFILCCYNIKEYQAIIQGGRKMNLKVHIYPLGKAMEIITAIAK